MVKMSRPLRPGPRRGKSCGWGGFGSLEAVPLVGAVAKRLGSALSAAAQRYRPLVVGQRKRLPQMIGHPEVERAVSERVGHFNDKRAIFTAPNRHDTRWRPRLVLIGAHAGASASTTSTRSRTRIGPPASAAAGGGVGSVDGSAAAAS
jgi:butyrate kinase